MSGMGDLYADEIALYTKIGPEYCHETIGTVSRIMPTITDQAIRDRIEYLYGDSCGMTIKQISTGGTSIHIKLPLKK